MTDGADATSDDRLGAWRVLLPAEPGPVVLRVDPELETALRVALPVGAGPEPTDGEAGLLVVDERQHAVAPLRRLLGPGGVLVVLGRAGEFRVHPESARPEAVWRAGWPAPPDADLGRGLRRWVALRLRRSTPRLSVADPLGGAPPVPSLAEEVLADVAGRTGLPGHLVGVVTASRTVLRMRTSGGDVAVRLSLSGAAEVGATAVAAEVPAVRMHLARELARGDTRGCPWVATSWATGPRDLRSVRATRRAAWRGAESVVDILTAVPTGTTGPGWSARWCASAERLPDGVRRRWAQVMAPLDGALPTAWCHGDLWLANLVMDGDRVVVLDWDNASRDAPAGLDRLLVMALRDRARSGRPAPELLLGLADTPDGRSGDVEVGGRRWGDWDREGRVAWALAAVVLHLRNRSSLTLTDTELERHVASVERAVAGSGVVR